MENLIKLRKIFTSREKKQLGLLLILFIALAFFQVVGVVSVIPFIGLVMEPNIVFENQWIYMVYETLNFTSVNRFIIFAGVAMFIIILTSNAISALATWAKFHFAWMNNHRLSRRLLEKYLVMPYAFFLNQNSSDLSKNVLGEVNSLTNGYLIPLLTIITRLLIAFFMLAMLLLVDVVITFVAAFVLGSIYVIIFWRINKSLKYRGKQRMEANNLRWMKISDVFGGIKEIKVMNRENYFIASYSKESLKQSRLMAWNTVIGQIPRFALEAIAFGGITLFVLIMLMTREDVRQVIPLAALFAFAGYRLIPALQEIFASYTLIQFNQAVIERIYNDFMLKEAVTLADLNQKDQFTKTIPFNIEITLERVNFNYPNTNKPVVKDINVSIKHNSSVAFVGPTGTGKTTLVDIILGLLTPQQGYLKVDGLIINQANLKNWQKNIGYVPQHIYLSDDTVAHNIAFGIHENEIDRAAVETAAHTANIYDFVNGELPNGFDTLVGERGIRLSGGQRQRIGIARALYHDPEVLVFDEATSALDTVTEEGVLSALENAAALKTLIIIAHRLTTVKTCDVIYMLDRGKIVASGTYNQLIETNSNFQKMAKVKG